MKWWPTSVGCFIFYKYIYFVSRNHPNDVQNLSQKIPSNMWLLRDSNKTEWQILWSMFSQWGCCSVSSMYRYVINMNSR